MVHVAVTLRSIVTLTFCAAELTLAAYCGDRVLAEETDEQTDRLIFYGEPTPESIGPLDDVICKQACCGTLM